MPDVAVSISAASSYLGRYCEFKMTRSGFDATGAVAYAQPVLSDADSIGKVRPAPFVRFTKALQVRQWRVFTVWQQASDCRLLVQCPVEKS